jgi:hypothetical protein
VLGSESKVPFRKDFYEHLILPRVKFSTIDAIFCAKFFLLLDKLIPDVFGTLGTILLYVLFLSLQTSFFLI